MHKRLARCVNVCKMRTLNCGNSSAGRAQPCQGWGREFESRFPLQFLLPRNWKYVHSGGMAEWLCSGLQIRGSRFDSGFRLHYTYTVCVSTRCPGGEIGRHKGFKIPRW